MVYPEKIREGIRIAEPVELLDVMPTILDVAGIDTTELLLQGRSLLPLLDAPGEGWPVLAEEWATINKTGGLADLFLVSVRTRDRKAILTRDLKSGAVRLEGYDLAQDPGETKDLSKGPGGLGGEGASPAFRDALGRARARLDAFVPGR